LDDLTDPPASNLNQETIFKGVIKKLRREKSIYSVIEAVPQNERVSYREIQPMPLIDTAEFDEGRTYWDDLNLSEKSIFNNIKIDNSEISAEEGWDFLWGEAYEYEEGCLNDYITKSEEYSLLFKNCFPVNRYLSMLAVHMFMSTSSMNGVNTAFIRTKGELFQLFDYLCTSCDLTNEDGKNCYSVPKPPKLVHCLDQKEYGLQSPCFSFNIGFGGTCIDLGGFGIDIPIKIALKTPVLIFKGFVEATDPNIKIAKFIYDLLKALSICIPLPLISLGLLPLNVIPPPVGFGPPLTQYGFAYLALMFESFLDYLWDNLFPAQNTNNTPTEYLTEEQCSALCAPFPIY
jgi:hypothetical protein